MKNLLNCICESKSDFTDLSEIVTSNINYKISGEDANSSNTDLIIKGIEERANNDFTILLNMAKLLNKKITSIKFNYNNVDKQNKKYECSVKIECNNKTLTIQSKSYDKVEVLLDSEKYDLSDKEYKLLRDNNYFIPFITADVFKRVMD